MLGKIVRVDRIAEQGCTSEVQKLYTHHDTYILKTSVKPRYREWLKAEAEVLERLSSQDIIPVPQFYRFIEEIERSHLLMSYEKGITLTAALKLANDNQEKKTLIKSFGHFLQKLHSTELIDYPNSSLNWLDSQLLKAEKYMVNGQTEGSKKLLEELKRNKPIPCEQTMIHGDCTTDNVLVVNGKVVVFIDVAGMTVGDPRYDVALAISSFQNNQMLLESFYEGYSRYRISKEEIQYFDAGLYEFF